MSHASRTPLHELRRICGAHETLPKSSTIPHSLQIGPSVDPGCVQVGTLDGAKVRVKSVRIYPNEHPRTTKKVYQRSHSISYPRVLTKPAGLQPISCDLETLEPPKYCPPSWCHYRPSPARFQMDALRGPRGVHRESPRPRQTWARRCSSCCVARRADPVTSCMT